MSEFLEDPSILTKDKLKSELLANNVALPSGEHRKDVYVQLYLNNLTVQNKKKVPLDAFSSDEELPPPLVSNKSRSGRKATRKTDKPRVDEVDVTDLTDEDLKDQLLKYGVSIGPIVASTRKLYEKKLQKMLERGPPEATPPLSAPTKIDSNQNGNTDSDQYSDKEEEERTVPEPEPEPELEPEPEPVPVVEKHVSRGKTPQRTRRQEYNREQAEDHLVLNVKRRQRRSSLRLDQTVPAGNNIALTDPDFLLNGVLQERIGQLASKSSKPYPLPKVEDRLVAGDQVSVVGEKDFLKEMFPNEVTTPTGISATCRRPIRGAAGRPLKASDFWIDESRLRRSERIETSSSFSESRTVLRAAAPLLSSSSSSSLVTAPSGGQVRTRRSLPVWVQLLLLSAVAGFLFFVYQAMETNKLNPFGSSDSPAPIAAGDGADQ